MKTAYISEKGRFPARTKFVETLRKFTQSPYGRLSPKSIPGVSVMSGGYQSVDDLHVFVPLSKIVNRQKKKLHSARFVGISWNEAPNAGSTFLLVTHGSLWVVVVDLRKGSATFGRNSTFDLKAGATCGAYIPIGCAFGYFPYSSRVQIELGFTTEPAPTHEKSLSLYDSSLGIKLPYALARLNFSVHKKTYLSLEDVTPFDTRTAYCSRGSIGEAILQTLRSPISDDVRLICPRAVDYVYDESCAAGVLHIRDYPTFIQVLGKLKYLLHQEGNAGLAVAFRGQTSGYPGPLRPSLFRGLHGPEDRKSREVLLEKKMKILRRYSSSLADIPDEAFEAVLQQYGVETRWIDAVDNIWVALWFACFRAVSSRQGHFLEYQRRDPATEKVKGRFAYVYVLGYPDPHLYGSSVSNCPGMYSALGIDCLDLRISTPSNYVRPHAQHGLMLRVKEGKRVADHFDVLVQAIIRVDLANALEWLGNGVSVSVKGLFPSPSYDTGFQTLLCIQDRLMLGHKDLYADLAIFQGDDKSQKEYRSVYFQRVW